MTEYKPQGDTEMGTTIEQKRKHLEYVLGNNAIITFRNYEYLETYGYKDILISLKPDPNGHTQMSNVMAGKIDKIFYSFLDENREIAKWAIFNGYKIRELIMNEKVHIRTKRNTTTCETFAILNLKDIKDCIIESSTSNSPIDVSYNGTDGFCHSAFLEDPNKFYSTTFSADTPETLWNRIKQYVNSNYKFGCQVNIWNQVTGENKALHVQPF